MTFQIAAGVWWVSAGRISLRWQLSADGGTPNSPTAAVTVPELRNDKSVCNRTFRIQNPLLLQNDTAHLDTICR
jgi:hypothetical protein